MERIYIQLSMIKWYMVLLQYSFYSLVNIWLQIVADRRTYDCKDLQGRCRKMKFLYKPSVADKCKVVWPTFAMTKCLYENNVLLLCGYQRNIMICYGNYFKPRTIVRENLVVAIHRSMNIMFIWSCPGMKKLLVILQT